MAFQGDLRTFDFSDLLDWIANRSKTGDLSISRHSTRKRLLFESGRIKGASSNDPRETLGQALVRDRRVGEEDLFKALLRQEKEGRLLGEILVAEGRITEDELIQALVAQAEDVVYDLFLWDDGRFSFEDEKTAASPGVALDIETQIILDEGLHRRGAWASLKQRFPSSSVTFRIETPPGSSMGDVEDQMVKLASEGKTLAAIALESRRSEFEAALICNRLCADGVLAVVAADSTNDDDPVGSILMKLAEAQDYLHGQRFDAARDAYQYVLGLDPLNQSGKKGLIAVSEARQAARIRQRVPLDGIPVLKVGAVALTQLKLDALEGFVVSRVNGQWDVRSILKLCPFPGDEAIMIFARLIDRRLVEIRKP